MISREVAEDFGRRHHSNHYEKFLRDNSKTAYPLFIDFEDLLTAIEKLPPYQLLLKGALTGKVESAMEKANIGTLVILQLLRSHSVMNAMIDRHHEIGYSKFEHFVTLRWLLSDQKFLLNLVNAIVCCQCFTADREMMFPAM